MREVAFGHLLRALVQIVNGAGNRLDRKSTRLNSSHSQISYAVFCLKKKTPVCPSRSRCARKNAHIRLDASILLLVRPTNHSGSGWPPGQVWPPPLMV